MVLSAALDNGYIFITLIAILTSVISAVYYLNIIKQIFFDKSEYIINPELNKIDIYGSITKKNILIEKLTFNYHNIILSSYLTISIIYININNFIIYIYASRMIKYG